MKKLRYIYMLLSCLWILTACNSEDLSYDIEYTPIHPLGGQYTVSVSRNGAVVAEHVDCFLANTSDYDTDKCWIRIGAILLAMRQKAISLMVRFHAMYLNCLFLVRTL